MIDLFYERLKRALPELNELFVEYREAVHQIDDWNAAADDAQSQIVGVLQELVRTTQESMSAASIFGWFEQQGYSAETITGIRKLFEERLGVTPKTKKSPSRIIAEALCAAMLTIMMESEDLAEDASEEGPKPGGAA